MSNTLAAICGVLKSYNVVDLRVDSRQIQVGDAFIAMAGAGGLKGVKFVASAFERGAACLIVDRIDAELIPENISSERVIVVEQLRTVLGELAAYFYATLDLQMPVIGVTGTNGKSSTAFFAAQLGSRGTRPAHFIGTVGCGPWDQLMEQENTTPSVVDVHRLIAVAANADAPLLVMEVSSHAIDQGRVDGVRFAARLLTNLGRDHLDYHGSIEIYHKLKTRWLEAAERFSFSSCEGYAQWVGVSDLKARPEGLSWCCQSAGFEAKVSVDLIGDFHSENISLALVAVDALGLIERDDLASMLLGLEPVPGRMQLLRVSGRPLGVVDFAHTAEAISRAVMALRAHGLKDITLVFGCGGDRDKTKRPLMMEAALDTADSVVLTSDNPRGEPAQDIIRDVLVGAGTRANEVRVEADRRKATQLAIENAPAHGVVLVAGKGHENYQIIGDQRFVYSDAQTLGELLRAES